MKPIAAAGLLLASFSAAPLQARTVDTFCSELRRIVHATGETPPFASLVSARVTLPGLSDGCNYYNDRHGRRISCIAGHADPGAWQALVDHSARCLPEAIRRPDESDPLLAQFRTATALIVIRQHTLPGDSRGIQLSYTVHPVPIH
jgi:hypothetical protein